MPACSARLIVSCLVEREDQRDICIWSVLEWLRNRLILSYLTSLLKDLWCWPFFLVTISSGKSANHERKSTLTPTQRESVAAKSPVPGVDPAVSHSPFEPHHRGGTPGEVYRSHLPAHLDPAMPFHRALDPGKHSAQ